jgi:glucose/arabinose dehydrogenase
MLFRVLVCWIALLAVATSFAEDKKPATEADYYKIIPFDIPKNVVLEAGGLEMMPGGKLAVSTRRGEIFFVENPLIKKPNDATFTRFATGLHEILGLAQKDGWLYCAQRGEVTRMKDSKHDGVADTFETVCDDWGLSGDYHEYAFLSKFDKEGNLWVTLCLTGSFSSNVKYRGWCLRITPEGKAIPTCSGLRSPGGVGMNAEGDMFFTDNQGPWNGACCLKYLKPGSFQGHPDGNKWYPYAESVMGPRPKDPVSGSRIAAEAAKIPEFLPPAVLFPYGKMGQSASGIACDLTDGKFGPFAKQLFVGDQTHSTVMRVYLEKVDGMYQGACFPFVQGIGSGALSLLMSDDGSLFVGGTNRGWGSRGGKPYSLDRIVWTGKKPFEIQEMHAEPDGFEFTFTEPVDREAAAKIAAYKAQTYCYIYQASYGSPEVDHTTPTVKSATVGSDGKSVKLVIDGLVAGHVHEFKLDGIRSAAGDPLLHDQAYYTLNKIPAKK